MAKFVVAKNDNKEKVNNYNTVTYSFLVIWIVLFVLGLITGTQALCLIGFPFIIIAAALNAYIQKYSSGIKGEETLKEGLGSLDDNHIVVLNPQFNYNQRRFECDAIVIGPEGVFIIEAKNHNGRIYGKPDSSQWIQRKTRKNGGDFNSKMKNPLKQNGFQIHMIATMLKDAGINQYVRGAVIFTNPKAKVEIEHDRVFTSMKHILRWINETNDKRKLEKDDIYSVLKVVKDNKLN